MSGPLQRLVAAVVGRSAAVRLQPVIVRCFLLLVFSTIVAQGQENRVGPSSVRSVSGQFIVAALPQDSPLLRRPDLAADTNLVRLEPALLAVAAERFKFALWSQLGFRPGSVGNGRIYLTLYPARTTNDDVNIELIPALEGWSYRMQLPDVITRTRYARALTGVLLLEIANRANRDPAHSAEMPPWLTDGLSRQILGGESGRIVFSTPSQKTDGLTMSRVDQKERGIDPLAGARRTLQDLQALTYNELCWPSDAQMNGYDGGAYLASAQLFVDSLLNLENGPGKMRSFLEQLPGCMNWQTAFYSAFQQQFKRPLDAEKWWSLRVIRFAARDPGPRWTMATSRERLGDLLAVPVEFREGKDALPEHTVVSLQNAIRNFRPAQLTAILDIKRRDFQLAQFRMAQPFAILADGYRDVITDFLGEGRNSKRLVTSGKNVATVRQGLGVAETVKRLDVLDARRRDLENKLDTNMVPKPLNPTAPGGVNLTGNKSNL